MTCSFCEDGSSCHVLLHITQQQSPGLQLGMVFSEMLAAGKEIILASQLHRLRGRAAVRRGGLWGNQLD